MSPFFAIFLMSSALVEPVHLQAIVDNLLATFVIRDFTAVVSGFRFDANKTRG